jgi:hypothetical protein
MELLPRRIDVGFASPEYEEIVASPEFRQRLGKIARMPVQISSRGRILPA